ncbi:MAG: sensor histidine kinase [Bacteroidia bacterium]
MAGEQHEKLRASEERYQKMIAEVKDYAILMLDVDGNIQNWNLGAEHIKGYTTSEAVGLNFRVFYRESDRKDKLPERLINEAYTTGRATNEGWRVRKNGSMFWGSVVITALHDTDGSVIGFSKVTRDLTERKLAEDQINNYMRDIELRNRQLEEFAYIASHDLQEPLRKIRIFSEMLVSSLNDPAAAAKYAGKINDGAARMSTLISGILKYSQLSSGEQIYENVDLNDVIKEVREDYELVMSEKKVLFLADPMPVIKAVRTQIIQLFANLISNAIKFSGRNPEIHITCKFATGTELKTHEIEGVEKSHVKISVADNGEGFDQQYADQVFKIFKRLTNNPGTGIGLALCKKIVENHHGSISVTSRPNAGTIFTIILPVEI